MIKPQNFVFDELLMYVSLSDFSLILYFAHSVVW